MATVHLPRSLVTLFPDPPPRIVDIAADSLDGLIAELDARWPGMRERLCEPGSALRDHINVYVDAERERDLATVLTPASVVHIIPAVAGGASYSNSTSSRSGG